MTTTSVDTPDVTMLERDGTSHRIPIPWYNRNRNVDEYYYWMATALDYKIEVYTYNVSTSICHRMVGFAHKLDM